MWFHPTHRHSLCVRHTSGWVGYTVHRNKRGSLPCKLQHITSANYDHRRHHYQCHTITAMLRVNEFYVCDKCEWVLCVWQHEWVICVRSVNKLYLLKPWSHHRRGCGSRPFFWSGRPGLDRKGLDGRCCSSGMALYRACPQLYAASPHSHTQPRPPCADNRVLWEKSTAEFLHVTYIHTLKGTHMYYKVT